MVGAARQAPALLVREAQRGQRRLLELERVRFLVAVRDRREVDVHAAHADRLLAQVVRLLDVERQDLVGDRALRHQQRQHRLGAQLLERGQPVVAVGRPVGRVAGLLAHRDDRIQEPLASCPSPASAGARGRRRCRAGTASARPCRRAGRSASACGRPAARGSWPARRRRPRARRSPAPPARPGASRARARSHRSSVGRSFTPRRFRGVPLGFFPRPFAFAFSTMSERCHSLSSEVRRPWREWSSARS